MLKKLLKLMKYDLRASGKLILPASLFVLGTTLLGAISNGLMSSDFLSYSYYEDNSAKMFMYMGMSMLFGISILVIVIYAVTAFILAIVNYYRNFFTDEGYLTFTLPVKTETLIVSKFLSAAIWMIFSGIVTVACIAMLVFSGGSAANEEIISEFNVVFADLGQAIGEAPIVAIEIVLIVIISAAFGLLQAFLSITIGGTLAKKHKILASIGSYYLINMVISAITNGFYISMLSVPLANMDRVNFVTVANGVLFVGIIFYAGLCVAAFLVNRHILKNRLNV